MHKDSKHQIAIEMTTTFLAQAYAQNKDFENAAKVRDEIENIQKSLEVLE